MKAQTKKNNSKSLSIYQWAKAIANTVGNRFYRPLLLDQASSSRQAGLQRSTFCSEKIPIILRNCSNRPDKLILINILTKSHLIQTLWGYKLDNNALIFRKRMGLVWFRSENKWRHKQTLHLCLNGGKCWSEPQNHYRKSRQDSTTPWACK